MLSRKKVGNWCIDDASFGHIGIGALLAQNPAVYFSRCGWGEAAPAPWLASVAAAAGVAAAAETAAGLLLNFCLERREKSTLRKWIACHILSVSRKALSFAPRS